MGKNETEKVLRPRKNSLTTFTSILLSQQYAWKAKPQFCQTNLHPILPNILSTLLSQNSLKCCGALSFVLVNSILHEFFKDKHSEVMTSSK